LRTRQSVRDNRLPGAEEGPGRGYTINFIGIAPGTVDDTVVKETCSGDAEYRADDNGDYGINPNPDSQDNVFVGNDAHGNGTSDFFNEAPTTVTVAATASAAPRATPCCPAEDLKRTDGRESDAMRR
jgi:hypothetical protein